MAKKTTNKKTNSAKTKKTVDVSNVDAIMEDMKNLALQKPVEEKVETKVEGKCLDEVVYGTGIVNKPEKVESDINTDVKDIDMVTTQSPKSETEDVVNTEQSTSEDTVNTEEQDLSFVEEISNGEVVVSEDEAEVEDKPKKHKNKSKRMDYSTMFGNTWCGYGYSI